MQHIISCRASAPAASRPRGFTLVELLVVIGIIALLISILLPSLNKARGAAQTTACLSNMRQLGQAVAIYQAQYKGSMPPLSSYAKNGSFSNNNFQGPNLWILLNVKAHSRVAVCPTAEANIDAPSWAASADNNRALFSYKYNWLISGAETNPIVAPNMPHATVDANKFVTPAPAKKISNASETLEFICYPQLVAFQTNDAPGTDRGMSWASAKPGGYMLGHQLIRSVAPSHGTLRRVGVLSDGSIAFGGYTNVLFCDGSARTLSVAQDQYNATADPRAQTVPNDTTTGGDMRAGNSCILEGVRLDPTVAP